MTPAQLSDLAQTASTRRHYPVGMAEAAQTENLPARLAHVRDSLKLLADYL